MMIGQIILNQIKKQNILAQYNILLLKRFLKQNFFQKVVKMFGLTFIKISFLVMFEAVTILDSTQVYSKTINVINHFQLKKI